MKILIYGAGAIGSDLGGMLSLQGEDVTLLARGAQLQALQSHGLRVNRPNQPEQTIAVRAVSAEQAGGGYDLIVVTLKSMQLAAVASDLIERLAPAGSLLMVQNGLPWWYFDRHPSAWSGARIECLDPQGELRNTLPLERVVGAVIYKPVTQTGPGQICLPSVMSPKLIVGEVDHSLSPRLSAIQSLFQQAGLDTEVSQNIRLAKWQKLMLNLIWNPLCAITQSSPGHIVASPQAEALVRQLIGEGRAVAHRLGMPVQVDEDQEIQRVRQNMTQQPSMLQDVRAGRPLEVDAIVNSVVELAELTDVPVPGLRQVASLLEVLNQCITRSGRGIAITSRA